jgi:hypothetical protein
MYITPLVGYVRVVYVRPELKQDGFAEFAPTPGWATLIPVEVSWMHAVPVSE